jgi:selenocysteine-specific elongation factor
MVEETIFAEVIEKVLAILELFHRDNPLKAGLSKEELRSKLYRGLSQKFFQSVLANLIKKKEIVQDGAEIRLAGHQVALQADEKEIRRDLEHLFKEAGLKPPTIKQVFAHFSDVPQALIRQVLNLLIQDGHRGDPDRQNRAQW